MKFLSLLTDHTVCTFPLASIITSKMPATEWTDAEHELDAHCGGVSPTVESADQLAVSSIVPGSSSTTERTSSPESKQNLHQAPTPPDRQRTAQACDKCRERKTKASILYIV